MSKAALILIVDDNPQNIQFLGKLLIDKGYEIGVALDGDSALEFVRERLPDLILLDVMMPRRDGYSVCKELKSDIRTRHIPIIFLTANNDQADVAKGFDLGATDYVTKPFIPAELLARVRAQLTINLLKHFLPICSYCQKVRDDNGVWLMLNEYLDKHTDTLFSHGICDKCIQALDE